MSLDLDNGEVRLYPDEPHPNNEHEWKSWWVKKCFRPDDVLTQGAIVWIHQCWQQTLASYEKSKRRQAA